MSKFIEVHDTIINTNDIRRVEFLGDDIYVGLFPEGDNGEIIVDYITFDFAKIYTFDGDSILMSIDLYKPEDDEVLKPTKLTGKEYE